jgi:hypothetical protein
MVTRQIQRTIGLAIAVVAVCAAPAVALMDQQFFVSNNNNLYYVVKIDAGSGIGGQVTSIMLTTGSANSLNETVSLTDPVLTSVSLASSGITLPDGMLSKIKRTQILTGFSSNDIAPSDFDGSANGGNGILTLPDGVRSVTFDGSSGESLQAITTSSGSGATLVPAAAKVTVSRRLGGTTSIAVQAIVFPNPAGSPTTSAGATCGGGSCVAGIPCDSANNAGADTGACGACSGTCSNAGGEVLTQNVTLDDTKNTRVGNDGGGATQASAVDGFLLHNTTDIIVFVVEGMQAFGLSASGFSVTGTCVGGTNDTHPCSGGDCEGGTCTAGLSARTVLDTTGDADTGFFNNLPPPPPTPTCPAVTGILRKLPRR